MENCHLSFIIIICLQAKVAYLEMKETLFLPLIEKKAASVISRKSVKMFVFSLEARYINSVGRRTGKLMRQK
ncbi:hypothetical protein HNY73_010395 [Argiope bruennichi]|uniref:Uncharacterized protein n=1 Tax=Argiope bruennichi TaxID=94029 RepID=A0A8T0F372_ARGBR|nr:hypothetical protein HNY73_010395 [Argiope bruennichi]